MEESSGTEPGQSEVEIGMGIHNEPGSERKAADQTGIVKTMLTHCLDPSDSDRSFLNISPADEVVLLVNNLGGVRTCFLRNFGFATLAWGSDWDFESCLELYSLALIKKIGY